jgi:FkbM family methyltransferase
MKQLVKAAARSFGYEVQRADTPLAALISDPSRSHMAYALVKVFRSLEGLRFLQIGANDGRRNDPICHLIDRFGWSGVFVEPDPVMMARLQVHRPGPRFTHVPFAVARQTGRLTFYSLEGKGLPEFANGLGTLSRERIEAAARHLEKFDPRIVERAIDCLSVPDLLAKVGKSFDVLVIDVEGLDYDILQLLAESHALAKIVHYEHKCLSEEDRQGSFALLMQTGYNLLITEEDCTAYRRC